MAWSSVGTLGTAQSGSSGSSLAITTSAAAAAGSVVVVIVAKDNVQTTDGNTSEVSSISDSAGGNTWTKAREFCNGQGSANAGAVVAVYYSRLINGIANGGTITANFSSSISAKAMTAWNFTASSNAVITATPTPTDLANDGADPGSMSLTGPGEERLYVRGIACESSSATALTNTTNFSLFSGTQSSGGNSASNMGVRGEFRILTSSGTVSSDPTLFSADCASVFVALKEVTGDVSTTPTGVSATVSVQAPTYQLQYPVTGVSATVSVGSVTTPGAQVKVYPTGVSATAAVGAPSLYLYSAVSLGGQEQLRLYLSGGVTNLLPMNSLGGYPSTQLLGVVSGQKATISGTPNITGLTLCECDGNALGNGTLEYTASTGLLKWTRSDASFDFITLGGDDYYLIGSAVSFLVVNVITALMPKSGTTTDTVAITANTQDLFDDLDYTQWNSGCVEYRGLYLKNTSGSTISHLTVYLTQPATGSVAFALELGPSTFGTMIGSDVEKKQVLHQQDFQQWYESCADSRTDTKDYYVPGLGVPFFLAAPTVAHSENPYSDGIGSQLLSVLADEADSTSKLSGLTWVTTRDFLDLPADYCIALWVRRTVPTGTPGAQDVPDSFSLDVYLY